MRMGTITAYQRGVGVSVRITPIDAEGLDVVLEPEHARVLGMNLGYLADAAVEAWYELGEKP